MILAIDTAPDLELRWGSMAVPDTAHSHIGIIRLTPDTVGKVECTLTTDTSSGCQGREPRTPRLGPGCLLKPIRRTYQIDGCGCQDVLEVRFGETEIAGSAQTKPTSPLRDGAFYAST